MTFKKKPKRILCPDCKTGQDSYLIDENSPVCPYLNCYNGYNCAYYVPITGNIVIENDSKDKGIIGKLASLFKRR